MLNCVKNCRFGDWELAGEGKKETPIQKYQRLQCEIKDLYEEINEIKVSHILISYFSLKYKNIFYATYIKQEKAEEEKEVESVVDIISQVQDLGKQLDSLQLEECLGNDLVATLSDPQGTRLK